MSSINLPASYEAAVVATIDPDAYAASTYTSDYVSMAKFKSLQAIVMAGTLGTNATIDAKLIQATDASGTSAKDITGKAITQLTEAGSDSDKQAVINVRDDELDINNGFTHVAVYLTVGTATSDAGVIVMGHNPVDGVASANDLASVDEIVL